MVDSYHSTAIRDSTVGGSSLSPATSRLIMSNGIAKDTDNTARIAQFMNNSEAIFIRSIQESPDDDAQRAIYADWLEERDDPRADYLRLESELRAIVPTEATDPDVQRDLLTKSALLQQQLRVAEAAVIAMDSHWIDEIGIGMDVVLLDFGKLKLDVVKQMRGITMFDLMTCKWLTETTPSVVLPALTAPVARRTFESLDAPWKGDSAAPIWCIQPTGKIPYRYRHIGSDGVGHPELRALPGVRRLVPRDTSSMLCLDGVHHHSGLHPHDVFLTGLMEQLQLPYPPPSGEIEATMIGRMPLQLGRVTGRDAQAAVIAKIHAMDSPYLHFCFVDDP